MSIRQMTRIWAESPAEGSDLLLLLAIADFANDDGEAYPSIPTLAKKARLTERGVQQSLARLKATDQIAVLYGSGPRGSNRYILGRGENGSGLSPLHHTPEADFTSTPKPASPGGENGSVGGVKMLSPKPLLEPRVPPPLPPQRGGVRKPIPSKGPEEPKNRAQLKMAELALSCRTLDEAHEQFQAWKEEHGDEFAFETGPPDTP